MREVWFQSGLGGVGWPSCHLLSQYLDPVADHCLNDKGVLKVTDAVAAPRLTFVDSWMRERRMEEVSLQTVLCVMFNDVILMIHRVWDIYGAIALLGYRGNSPYVNIVGA